MIAKVFFTSEIIGDKHSNVTCKRVLSDRHIFFIYTLSIVTRSAQSIYVYSFKGQCRKPDFTGCKEIIENAIQAINTNQNVSCLLTLVLK